MDSTSEPPTVPVPTEEPEEAFDFQEYSYQYKPLPTASSIRLVHLESLEEDSDVLILSTRIVDLDDKPEYDGLSYSWGNPLSVFHTQEEREEAENAEDLLVICDNQILEVGRNLWYFLYTWRRMLHMTAAGGEQAKEAREAGLLPPSELWVDAISINQADMDEKAAQVNMMGRIYSQTQKVIVWLGPEDMFARPAVKLLFKLRETSQLKARAAALMTNDEACSSMGLPPITSSIWWSVFAFFHRSWFRRVWVMQELAFAPKAQIQVGSITFPWLALTGSAAVLYESGLGDPMDALAWGEVRGPGMEEPLFDDDLSPIIRTFERPDSDRNLFVTQSLKNVGKSFFNVIRLEATRVGDGSRLGDMSRYGFKLGSKSKDISPSIPILHMFDNTRRTEATDARDKIYALLDIAKRDTHDSEHTSRLRRPIAPNYHLSTEEVYLEAAWYVLLSGKDLELLLRTSLAPTEEMSNPNRLKLPSWVPDWTTVPWAAPMWSLDAFRDVGWLSARDTSWAPPDGTVAYGTVLLVQGIRVDVVEDAVQADSSEHIIGLLRCAEIAAGLPSVYPWTSDSLTPGNVLWRVLIANYDEDVYPAPANYNEAFHQLWLKAGKTAYREYYCSEGLSDPKKEAEWYRFVNHGRKLFPREYEKIVAPEVGGGDGNATERNDSQSEDRDPRPTPLEQQDVVVDGLAGIEGKQPETSGHQASLTGVEEGDRPSQIIKAAQFPKFDLDEQPLSQIDLMLKQLSESTGVSLDDSNSLQRQEETSQRATSGVGETLTVTPTLTITTRPEMQATPEWLAHKLDRLHSKVSPGRRIFRTRDNYLGNGPRSIEVGDEVWVLAGLKVPFLLRPQGNGRYLAVGDAYVHGLMHGEALERKGSDFVTVELD
ncbi:hypothetical protein NKR23_g1143 [Pleurostoma richardsiae]|uniref:Heterokaryon incompatibility domain-containing protein n=1 Tax=Pleurostoma richardsiae TaxID=41990 RepID=A0AA38VZJ5_9PEZI|nr:hypothetical protein NKR23_g1143 [Pleurostoma richardsiae]